MVDTANEAKQALSTAVLTVSDSRSEAEDTSGRYLAEQLQAAGHLLQEKCIVRDEIHLIRKVVSRWIASPDVEVILVTGGTGFSGRDSTPEAVRPLFDKEVDGFGEMFRQLSYDDIGTSALQSRALAGLAGGTIIFCMPGSTGACRLAWESILAEQLDSTHKPCNFVGILGSANRRD